MDVRIGCSGWNYRHWKTPVYADAPARRWLELYAGRFDTVEVNATFYRLPSVRAVAGWIASTPPGFVFAVKASRYLTHIRRLRDLGAGLERFYACIEPLVSSPKLGPVLWQLPETFHRDDERLAAALERLPPGRHAFEFRHPSWFTGDVYELLRGARRRVGDRRHSRAAVPDARAHGAVAVRPVPPRTARPAGQLLRDRAAGLGGTPRAPGPTTRFLYFNNDWEAFAVRNALRLRNLVGDRPAADSG